MFLSISVSLLVCLLAGLSYAKFTQPIFTKFDGKLTRGPRKKPLFLVAIRNTFR